MRDSGLILRQHLHHHHQNTKKKSVRKTGLNLWKPGGSVLEGFKADTSNNRYFVTNHSQKQLFLWKQRLTVTRFKLNSQLSVALGDELLSLSFTLCCRYETAPDSPTRIRSAWAAVVGTEEEEEKEEEEEEEEEEAGILPLLFLQ